MRFAFDSYHRTRECALTCHELEELSRSIRYRAEFSNRFRWMTPPQLPSVSICRPDDERLTCRKPQGTLGPRFEEFVDCLPGPGTAAEAVVVEHENAAGNSPRVEERAAVENGLVDVDVDVSHTELRRLERNRGGRKEPWVKGHVRTIGEVGADIVELRVAEIAALV